MNPEQKSKWLAEIDKAIAKREITIEGTKHARNNADSAMTSRHDTQREIFNTDLNIQLDGLEADKKLKEEISQSGERDRVESGAYLELNFDGDIENYLFMNNHGRLPDVDIITPRSPIGKAIIGKGEGDRATYRVGSDNIIVEIKKVQ